MIFIRVDLPAPFSPSTAWISPGCTAREMSLLATTAGYRLVMCASWSLGVVMPGFVGLSRSTATKRKQL